MREILQNILRINSGASNQHEQQSCPICNGTGWIYFEDSNGCDAARECECMKKRKFEISGVPYIYREARLSNFLSSVYSPQGAAIIHQVASAVKYWLSEIEQMSNEGIGLYMYSATKGSGKTRLAASITNELIENGISVKFTTGSMILQNIKKSWDKKNEGFTESGLIDNLINTQVLVIDDFGIEDERQWINERFYNLINGRYEGKKITIFTSNYRINDLRCDERIISRIREKTLEIPFPEESVRDRIARKHTYDMKSHIVASNN